MFKKKKKSHQWGILDCEKGTLVELVQNPFVFGSTNQSDHRVKPSGDLSGEIIFRASGNGVLLIDQAEGFLVDEQPARPGPLNPGEDYALRLGERLFLLRGDEDLSAWMNGIELSEWWICLDERAENLDGSFSLDTAKLRAKKRAQSGGSCYGIFPNGAGKTFVCHQAVASESAPKPDSADSTTLPSSKGELQCMSCWNRFDFEDLMHISTHHELIGDSVLGEDASRRFLASRFDHDGNALDPMGNPSAGIACPHCHLELPVNFLQTKYSIFSLVGNASAGKSYYLSVLSRALPRTLIREFKVTFQDADPTSNAPLTEMRNRLFSGSDAGGSALDKTVLGGNMYRDVFRHGRKVKMPRPFSFVLQPEDEEDEVGVTFYDNAGEHFQPGIEIQDSPGALHVAAAKGVFFLFDPLRNMDFREKIKNSEDPQLKSPMNDVQAVILSEMRTRIRRILGQAAEGRVDVPLAFVVGKYDAWSELLPTAEIESYISSGTLDCGALDRNSDKVRRLLLEICPELVANAESLSSIVRYFPVSSFGHTPVQTESGSIAPEPSLLKPMNVEAPAIWLLAKSFEFIKQTEG